jgi:CRP-like cAMP-binding protein
MTKIARNYKELLRTGRWFSGLQDELQDLLLGAAIVRTLPPGSRLFSRGDPPCGLWAMVDGAARIIGLAESGKEALLTLQEPPAWFGEIAVFDGLPRTHDAVAEGECTALQVPQPALEAILAAEPSYWRDLGRLVGGKLRLALAAMEEAALLPTQIRLIRRLVRMAEGYGDWKTRESRVVGVRQDQLASMLAISRQTA